MHVARCCVVFPEEFRKGPVFTVFGQPTINVRTCDTFQPGKPSEKTSENFFVAGHALPSAIICSSGVSSSDVIAFASSEVVYIVRRGSPQ